MDLWRIIVSFIFGAISFWMTIPLTTLLLGQGGVDPAVIGAFASMPWLALLVASPVLPALIRRLGLLSAYRLGIAMSLVSITCFALTDALSAWFVCNALMGVGLGVRWIVVDSWVAQGVPANKRGRIVGLYETLSGAAIGMGPLLLMPIVTMVYVPYAVVAGLLLISLMPIVGIRNPNLLNVSNSKRVNFLAIIRSSPIMFLTAFVCGIVESAAIAVLPLYGLSLGLHPNIAALLVTAVSAGNVLSQYPLGYLADRVNRRRLLLMCGVAVLLIPLLLSLMSGTDLLLWLVVILWGCAIGSLYTLAVIQAGTEFAGNRLVSAIAAIVTTYTLGAVIGPAMGGTILATWVHAD